MRFNNYFSTVVLSNLDSADTAANQFWISANIPVRVPPTHGVPLVPGQSVKLRITHPTKICGNECACVRKRVKMASDLGKIIQIEEWPKTCAAWHRLTSAVANLKQAWGSLIEQKHTSLSPKERYPPDFS